MSQDRKAPTQPQRLDPILPPAIARRAEDVGVTKANMDAITMGVLAVLAGAFIAFGAMFFTTVTSSDALPYGISQLLGGVVFSIGLVLVLAAGAELFTGNNLITMAWANGRVSSFQLARNWVIVFAGNFVGAVGAAAMMLLAQQYQFAEGAVGQNALEIAAAKVDLTFIQAMTLGIFGNALICLAVWISFAAQTITDKVLAVIFPVSAMVAMGFEHCVASMYYLALGLLIKATAPNAFWNDIGAHPGDFAQVTVNGAVINNLVPVTMGNIIGGGVLVGLVYWFCYIRRGHV